MQPPGSRGHPILSLAGEPSEWPGRRSSGDARVLAHGHHGDTAMEPAGMFKGKWAPWRRRCLPGHRASYWRSAIRGTETVGERVPGIRGSSGLPVHARPGLAGGPLDWGAGAAALYQEANASFQWYPANQKGEALPRRHAPHGLRATDASTGTYRKARQRGPGMERGRSMNSWMGGGRGSGGGFELAMADALAGTYRRTRQPGGGWVEGGRLSKVRV